jgi:hypothetical protein
MVQPEQVPQLVRRDVGDVEAAGLGAGRELVARAVEQHVGIGDATLSVEPDRRQRDDPRSGREVPGRVRLVEQQQVQVVRPPVRARLLRARAVLDQPCSRALELVPRAERAAQRGKLLGSVEIVRTRGLDHDGDRARIRPVQRLLVRRIVQPHVRPPQRGQPAQRGRARRSCECGSHQRRSTPDRASLRSARVRTAASISRTRRS